MDKDIVTLEPQSIGGLIEPFSSIGVWDWDLASNVIYADEAVAHAFELNADLTRKGLPPEAYFSRIHEDDRQMIIDHSNRSIATRGNCTDNFRIVRSTGWKWVHSEGRCFADNENNPRCFIGLISDIAPQSHLDHAESSVFPGGTLSDDVLYLCLHAKRIAMHAKRPFLTYLLEMVIAEVTETTIVNRC